MQKAGVLVSQVRLLQAHQVVDRRLALVVHVPGLASQRHVIPQRRALLLRHALLSRLSKSELRVLLLLVQALALGVCRWLHVLERVAHLQP